ncbi:MFS transporter [Virgibacillus dokdonensis]|uniref:Enterobactin exporter EntS n=1 Tax=Virgibacillus dokdonensis TaxID=302167 RepID=A0A2K9J893_9BACI|nr:MFS transporter [Virgibacillus dokdonensis]AUJ26931.1 enterobactin exporter EntS [Virgibacillus dokdonensis]
MKQSFIKVDTSIWKISVFNRLFASYSVSMFGTWFDMLAMIVLFSYEWQLGPMLISFIPVAYALPQVILSQFAGVILDRYSKIRVMLIADISAAILTFIIVFIQSAWPVLFIIMIRSAVTVVHGPAQQAIIKQVVPDHLILQAVTLNGVVSQLSKIIGPMVGGALISVISPIYIILINAISLLMSALILFSILRSASYHIICTNGEVERQTEGSFFRLWMEGWMVILRRKILIFSMLIMVIGVTGVQMVDIQIGVILRMFAPAKPELAGWLMGASGLGAVLAILVLNRYTALKQYGRLLGLSLFLVGIGFGGVGWLTHGFLTLYLLLLGFIAGIGIGLLNSIFSYIIQMNTSASEISRVTGITNTVISSTVILSPLIGGLLAEVVGIISLYRWVGISLVIVSLFCIISNKWFNEGRLLNVREQSIS